MHFAKTQTFNLALELQAHFLEWRLARFGKVLFIYIYAYFCCCKIYIYIINVYFIVARVHIYAQMMIPFHGDQNHEQRFPQHHSAGY